jgi:Flp pilus assembly pilin Flp
VAVAFDGICCEVKRERSVNRFVQKLRRCAADETGGEVLEYVLIAGLIVVATVVVIGAVGTKVLARWTSVNDGVP